MGDWLVKILLVQHALITVAYGIGGQWLKAFYWLGVFIVNLSWALMLIGRMK